MRTRINLKLAIPLVLVIAIGFTLLNVVVIHLFRVQYEALSADYINALTTDYSDRIENVITRTLGTAKSLSLSVENAVKKGSPRQDVLDVVAATLIANPELVGIGVGFEPNAYDGKDSAGIGADYNDEVGRFVPYTFVENGKPVYGILEGYDDTGEDSSWYTVPKATGKTYVTNPYWYNVGIEQHLIFTCVSPVLDDSGKFLAMVGFDIPVDTLSGILQDARLFNTGRVALIAPNGMVAYHPDISLEGRPVGELVDDGVVDAISYVAAAGNNNLLKPVIGNSKVDGEELQYTVTPIQVGQTGDPWVVISVVPTAEINQITLDTIKMASLVGTIAGVVILAVIIFMVRGLILKPIQRAKKATDQLAKGSLGINLGNVSRDELGVLMANMMKTDKAWQGYINNIAGTLNSVAQGNLDVHIDMDYAGDFMPIKSAMLQILDNLNETMSSVSASAHQVMTGAQQVADGAQSLSRSSMDQADSVEQLADIVENLSEEIHQTAENAKSADEQSLFVQRETELSNRKMQDMLRAMSEIRNSSDEISKIIQTIDSIAFQTNILALNASVEAARAGEAGKGFAVVAAEVRNLANKSSEASRESAVLIEKSLAAVEHGANAVDAAVKSMSSVSEGVTEVTRNIKEISDASAGQSEAARRITMSVHNISSAVQSNSINAQQSAAISEELSGQSQMMNDVVGRFRLRD